MVAVPHLAPVPNHPALVEAYAGVDAVVGELDDLGLQRPTRCRGWVVADLLCHLLADAQRALVTLASPVAGPADVDSVTYWQAFPGVSPANVPGASPADAGRDAWSARRYASAFDRPVTVARAWTETAAAAVRAAGKADACGFVTTQGHVLSVPDFLATLVTEAVVHHLDLIVELPDAPLPGQSAVEVAVSTMDGLLSDEAVRPGDWSDVEHLLKASGRIPLSAHDRRELGEAAGWFPLIG